MKFNRKVLSVVRSYFFWIIGFIKDLPWIYELLLQLTLVLANPEGPSNLVRYNEEFGKSELFKNGFKNNNYTIFDSTACFNDQIKSLQDELKPIEKFFNCCLLFLHFLNETSQAASQSLSHTSRHF